MGKERERKELSYSESQRKKERKKERYSERVRRKVIMGKKENYSEIEKKKVEILVLIYYSVPIMAVGRVEFCFFGMR